MHLVPEFVQKTQQEYAVVGRWAVFDTRNNFKNTAHVSFLNYAHILLEYLLFKLALNQTEKIIFLLEIVQH